MSWNGRGVIHHDLRVRDLKRLEIQRLSRGVHFVCLQEVHGCHSEVLSTLSLWLPGCRFWFSVCLAEDGRVLRDTGGVLIAAAPVVVAAATRFEHIIHCHGRVQEVTVVFGSKRVRIVHIHNCMLQRSWVFDLRNIISEDRVSPLENFSLIMGDMNFMARGARRFKPGQPLASGSSNGHTSSPGSAHYCPPVYHAFQHIWNKVLSLWVEVSQPFPTHIANNGGSRRIIDRCWTSLLPSRLCCLKVESMVIESPETYSCNGLSDHSPILVQFAAKCPTEVQDHSIPRFICENEEFANVVRVYADAIKLEELVPHQQVSMLKKCFRAASVFVRNTHSLVSDSVDARRVVIDSVSRAIWNQDLKLAKRLFENSMVAQELLHIEDRTMTLSNPLLCDDVYNSVKSEMHLRLDAKLEQHTSTATSSTSRKQFKSRLQASRRQGMLYWPTNKKLQLRGLIVKQEDGSQVIEVSPSVMQNALVNFGGPVYSRKAINVDEASKVLGVYKRRCGNMFRFSAPPLPEPSFLEESIRRAKHSAAGCDGIPYAAYKACPELSASVLCSRSRELALFSPNDSCEVGPTSALSPLAPPDLDTLNR